MAEVRTFSLPTPGAIGWVIALIVLLLAILGLIGVVPPAEHEHFVFALLAGLALSRMT